MNDNANTPAAGRTGRRSSSSARTGRACDELWDLWTTKEGFESWWGPEGFRVEVHALEARVGGALHYDMIADAPEQIEAMKRMGQPTSHETPRPVRRVQADRTAGDHAHDRLPSGRDALREHDGGGVLPSGRSSVRMVVTLDPMHDDEFTKMQTMGFTSQLTKLDQRFGGGR